MFVPSLSFSALTPEEIDDFTDNTVRFYNIFFGLEGSWGQPQGPNFPSP